MLINSGVLADNGVMIPIESLINVIDASVAGTVTTTVVYNGNTYIQSAVTVAGVTTIGKFMVQ